MTTDEIKLARISEAFLVRAFVMAQADKQLGETVQNAVDADRSATALAKREGEKILRVAGRFGFDPNGPILRHVDEKTQAYIAPIIIRLAEAFAGALIAAQVRPEDLKRIVPQKEQNAVNSGSFAAHGNVSLARLFNPA
jgi:hypothetical protein